MESLKIIPAPGTGVVTITSTNPLEAAAAAEIIEAAAYIDELPLNIDFVEAEQTYYFFFEPADEAASNLVVDLAYEYGANGIGGVLELEPLFIPYLNNITKGEFDGKFDKAAMDAAIAGTKLPLVKGAPVPAAAKEEAGMPKWLIPSLVTAGVVGAISWFMWNGRSRS